MIFEVLPDESKFTRESRLWVEVGNELVRHKNRHPDSDEWGIIEDRRLIYLEQVNEWGVPVSRRRTVEKLDLQVQMTFRGLNKGLEPPRFEVCQAAGKVYARYVGVVEPEAKTAFDRKLEERGVSVRRDIRTLAR